MKYPREHSHSHLAGTRFLSDFVPGAASESAAACEEVGWRPVNTQQGRQYLAAPRARTFFRAIKHGGLLGNSRSFQNFMKVFNGKIIYILWDVQLPCLIIGGYSVRFFSLAVTSTHGVYLFFLLSRYHKSVLHPVVHGISPTMYK